MATQIEIKNSIVRQIANEFFQKIPFYYTENGVEEYISSVEDFRKIVAGGQISVTSGQQNKLILYQQDYQAQTPPTDFDIVIDLLTRCYCNGAVTINDTDDGGHTCSGEYSTYSYIDISFHYLNTFNNSYDYFTINTTPNYGNCHGDRNVTIDTTVLSILSQYIPFDYTQVNIDPTQAQQVLDTNIFELMPQQTLRQQQINKFFGDYSNLKGPVGSSPPPFSDINQDGIIETTDPNYDTTNDISSGGEYITRLESNEDSDTNDSKSLQWLRND